MFVLERGHTVCQHVVRTQRSRTEPELLNLSNGHIDSNTHADKMHKSGFYCQKEKRMIVLHLHFRGAYMQIVGQLEISP